LNEKCLASCRVGGQKILQSTGVCIANISNVDRIPKIQPTPKSEWRFEFTNASVNRRDQLMITLCMDQKGPPEGQIGIFAHLPHRR
jgi:hypothetical protein